MKENKYINYVAILGIAAVFYFLYDKNIKKKKDEEAKNKVNELKNVSKVLSSKLIFK
ncbi:MAG: hypothetical protein ACOVNU_09140 [Candidatus Kapaibacteriota bacterium]